MSFLGFLGKTVGGFLLGGPAGAVAGAGAYLAGASGGGGLNSAALPTASPPPSSLGGFTGLAKLGVSLYGPSISRGFTGQTTGFGLPGGQLPTSPFPIWAAGGGGFAQAPPAAETGVMKAGATSDLPTGADMVACDIKGHHLNKSHYYTKGGPMRLGVPVEHEKGSTCVKNRRMNVGNARALRHALRRARGFEKLAMRTIRILHPTKRKRFGGFKTRARSR